MSIFDYVASKELALRLVEKFGTECKIVSPTKTYKVKLVFMENKKLDRPDGPVQTQIKKVYVAGTNMDININNRVDVKGTQYLITGVELYNFDNNTKVLYILDIAK